jgi:uncharacterized protein YcnI/copper(I)-binding protein
MTIAKLLARPLLAAMSLFLGGSVAQAHVTMAPNSTSNGAAVRLVFTVPHGCDGAATTGFEVKIPEGFVSAKPQPKPGWQLTIGSAAYARAYTVFGEAVTTGAVDISWQGGNLPDDQFDEFVISGTLQGFETPARLAFPVVQSCGAASVGWTEIPPVGGAAHGLKHPAPELDVTLTPARDAMPGMDMSGTDMSGTDMSGMDMSGIDMGTAASTVPGPDKPVTLGNLSITRPFARAMLPGQPTGGGYLSIANSGSADDTLVGASSPAARSVTLHEMKMNGSVMEMRALPDGIRIPAGATVALSPDGLHMMFENVSAPFRPGGRIPVTLVFAHAGKVEIDLPVAAIGATAPGQ